LEGIRERFLPERAFRGRENHKFRFAVLLRSSQVSRPSARF
jgi:hypothetical protein